MRPVYAIQVECDPGVWGVVRLNGVPVLRWRPAEAMNTVRKVNMWTLGGANRVTLELQAPRETGDDAGVAVATARARIRFLRFNEDGLQDPPAVLMSASVPPLASPGGAPPLPPPLPFAATYPVPVPDRPPGDFLPQAPRVTLGTGDLLEIRRLVRSLCEACAAGRWDEVRELLRYKARDLALTAYIDPNPAPDQQVEFLQTMLETPGRRVLVPEDLAIRAEVVADGRAVLVFTGNGDAALRFEQDRVARDLMIVYIGKVDGRWTIVR